MDTHQLYSDDTTCQSEALERDAENLADDARLYGCPTHEVWQHRGETLILDRKEAILKELNQVREGIFYIIERVPFEGMDSETSDNYIALSAKEDELTLSLIAA